MAVQESSVATIVEKARLLSEVFTELPFRYVAPLISRLLAHFYVQTKNKI
jgi:hypothetical protein